jgi:hypothetical protein
MEPGAVIVLACIGAVVLVPLVLEYVELRRGFGLGRLGALGTTLLVLPAFGVGVAASQPFGGRPGPQWATVVIVTVVVYSLATRALLRLASEPAGGR